MRRLYQTIYLAVIASLLAVVVIAMAVFRFGPGVPPMAQGFELAAEFVAAALPGPERPAAEQAEALRRIAENVGVDLALFDPAGRPIYATIPGFGPPPRGPPGAVMMGRGGGAWGLRLPDGRMIAMRAPPRHGNPLLALLATLVIVAGVVALVAYPFVRGLTRRIERLQQSVETLGGGDLAARAPVEGKDEVARLAGAFNRAAGRIEELVGAHRMLLAAASHELRTPLARLRLGLALLQEKDDPQYRASIEKDLRELEELIEDILTTSRLDALKTIEQAEPVDLLGLVAEEAANYPDASVEGQSAMLLGDPRLLRLLARNLIENAHRHARPPVTLRVSALAKGAALDVIDAGPGIPPSQRARIFEPFYQARRDNGGSGLGLALVARIARLHGGEAQALDHAGGAHIRVTLPGV